MKLHKLGLGMLLPAIVLSVFSVGMIISWVMSIEKRETRIIERAKEDLLEEVSRASSLAQRWVQTDKQLLDEEFAHQRTDTRFSLAAVINSDGRIIDATRLDLIGALAVGQLRGINSRVLDQAIHQRAAIFKNTPVGKFACAVMSYVEPSQAGELRSFKRGAVYIEYDLSSSIADARQDALVSRLPELAVLLFLAIVLAFLLHRMVVTPLQRLEQVTQAISSGQYVWQTELSGPREIYSLGVSFKEMAERLAATIHNLNRESKRTQAILDNAIDGIITMDQSAQIVSFNRAAEKMFGYSAAEVLGQNVKMLMPEPVRSAHDQYIRSYHETGVANIIGKEREMEAQRKDGAIFAISITVAEMQFEDTLIYIGCLSDISARKQAENEVRSLNAKLEQRVKERTADLVAVNKELEAFSYSVSHDLRAPLRAIDGFSQAIAEDYASKLDDTGHDYLQRVRNATMRMGQLIDDLLKLSRISRSPLNSVEVNLSALASDIVTNLQETDQLRSVKWAIAENVQANADKGLMRIALQNLFENAWKYTRKLDHASIAFYTEVHDAHTVYCVCDNGVGFDMQHTGKLFGAFQRLHQSDEFEGTGIGLATVARIIHRHGGRIWAAAEMGKGAAFYFTLGK